MTDLAILYEHPAWLVPLFAALDRRGIAYERLAPDGHFIRCPTVASAPNLVGTPEQLKERIAEYEAAGLDLLLLQMSPQTEEMERFANQVMGTA